MKALLLGLLVMAAAVRAEPVDKIRQKIGIKERAALTQPQRVTIDLMYERPTMRVLAGGSGFGGKSHTARAALMHYSVRSAKRGWPVTKTVLATSTYPDLRDRHIEPLQKEWGDIGEVREDDKVFGRCFKFVDKRMPVICLRNLDVTGKRGSEFGAGVLDEATENPKRAWGEFVYMVRHPGAPYNPILCLTNPDGIGLPWVKGLWRPLQRQPRPEGLTDSEMVAALMADPMCSVPFPARSEDADADPADYVLVQFRPEDNPLFDEKRFWAMVSGLPRHVQLARRWGKWDAAEGARWPWLRDDRTLFRAKTLWPGGLPPGWFQMVSVDWGISNPFAALWTAMDGDRNLYTWQEEYHAGLGTEAQIEMIREGTPQGLTIGRFVGDPSMWSAQRNVTSGEWEPAPAETYNEAVRGDARFPDGFVPGSTGRREHKFATLDSYFGYDNGHPDWFIEESCSAFWGEMTGAVFAMRQDGTREEDIDKRSPDHAITAAAYAVHKWMPEPAAPEPTIIERVAAERAAMAEERAMKHLEDLQRWR